jgi:hypothetical protein
MCDNPCYRDDRRYNYYTMDDITYDRYSGPMPTGQFTEPTGAEVAAERVARRCRRVWAFRSVALQADLLHSFAKLPRNVQRATCGHTAVTWPRVHMQTCSSCSINRTRRRKPKNLSRTSHRMPKPTLLQTLLGRPSQSYTFPPDKQHYSSKDDLARAAAALALSSSCDAPPTFGHAEVAPLAPVERTTDTDDKDDDQKGMATVTVNRRGLSAAAVPSNKDIPQPFSAPSPQQQITSDSDDDSGEDIFYTPFSSPPTSMLIDPPLSFVVPPDPSPSHNPQDNSTTTTYTSSSTQ